MIKRIGWGTYLFFAIVNASFFPILYFLYPEVSQFFLIQPDKH